LFFTPFHVIITSMELDDIREAYPEAIAIVEMAETVWIGEPHIRRVDFAPTDRLKVELKRLLGKDIETVFITDSDVRHIKKNHGRNEAARGQVDITPADFALIPCVMNEFDTARHEETDRLGNRKIIFVKRTNGTVYTASVEMGNTKVRVITLWKVPAKVLDDGESPSKPNVRNVP
jgi:hypothetical protein